MKRTTIFIDEELERDLRAIAEQDRRPVSGLVREAVASYVALRKKARTKPGFVAVGRSGRHDTSELHEKLLWNQGGRGRSRAAPPPSSLPKRNRG